MSTQSIHQIFPTSLSSAGLTSRDINRAQSPPPTLSLPSPLLIWGAPQLQPSERSAALSRLFGEDESGAATSTRIFHQIRLSPRWDETFPSRRGRHGSADRCVKDHCMYLSLISEGFPAPWTRTRSPPAIVLHPIQHFSLSCRESSASNWKRRAERRCGMFLSHNSTFMWMNCANAWLFLLQVTRCLVDVLSKALSKPDSQLDPECKDILLAGLEPISPQFTKKFKF